MAINFINPIDRVANSTSTHNLITDHYNLSKDKKLFLDRMPQRALDLLDGMNVALLYRATHDYDPIGPTAAFMMTENIGTPYIVIYMNQIYPLLRRAKIMTRLSLIGLIEHEMIHYHQYRRGDLDITHDHKVIWKRRVYNYDPDYSNDFEYYEHQLSLPYEMEPYLYNFHKMRWLLPRKMKPLIKKAKEDYRKIFRKDFDPKYYDELLYGKV